MIAYEDPVLEGHNRGDAPRGKPRGFLTLVRQFFFLLQRACIRCRAADGTWHRPLTTLELAILQGFPVMVRGKYLKLSGGSQEQWRKRIGNAVPPAAAEAVARQMMKTLEASERGDFLMSATPVWVERALQC